MALARILMTGSDKIIKFCLSVLAPELEPRQRLARPLRRRNTQ
jgi:hypothetical protein